MVCAFWKPSWLVAPDWSSFYGTVCDHKSCTPCMKIDAVSCQRTIKLHENIKCVAGSRSAPGTKTNMLCQLCHDRCSRRATIIYFPALSDPLLASEADNMLGQRECDHQTCPSRLLSRAIKHWVISSFFYKANNSAFQTFIDQQVLRSS